jgi:hypothetical protein
MSASWDDTRRRYRVMTAVLDDVAATGDPAVVHRHRIEEAFEDLDALLLAVHARWSTAVLARADDVLESDPVDPAQALAAALHELDTALPGARLLIEGHAVRPSVRSAAERLRRRIRADLDVDLADLPSVPGSVRCPVFGSWLRFAS